jgi:hypothetical protein
MPAVANVQPQATLEVVADESVLEPGSPEQEDFIAQLIRDLAASLGVEESEIQIDPASLRRGRRRLEDSRRALQDGAIQFDFVISSPNSAAAIAELNVQLADPESDLRNAPSTQALNPDVLPVLEFVCPDRMVIPPGLTTCQFCPAGQEPDDPDDPVGCQLCSASGSYLVSENGTCHTCTPGKTPREDLTGCDNCENGFFSVDGRECLACPEGQASNYARDGCTCANNYYNTTQGQIQCYTAGGQFEPLPAPQGVCAICGDALPCVECSYNSDTDRVSYVKMRRGFGLSMTKLDQGRPFEQIVGQRAVYPCPMDASDPNRVDRVCGCDAELYVTETGGQPNSGCADAASPCLEGYQGPLCTFCEEGWSRPGLKGECEKCSAVLGTLWVVFAAVLAVSFVTGLLYKMSSTGSANVKLIVTITLGKIFVSLIQILSQLEFTLQMEWPKEFKWFIEYLKLFSFDFLAFMDIGCMTTYSYFGKFFFAFMMMPTLLASVFVVYTLRKNVVAEDAKKRAGLVALILAQGKLGEDDAAALRAELSGLDSSKLRQRAEEGGADKAEVEKAEEVDESDPQVTQAAAEAAEEIYNRCIKMALTAVFFSYPFVSQTMFQGFSCRELDVISESEDERYLDVDYQISCNSNEYVVFWTVGLVGVFAYPIGIPTLTLLLLLKNGQQIKEQDSKARQRYEFLVADYKPQFYFWDCFEMLRKVSITGILMFVGQQGSLFQLVVGIILCVGFGFTAAWFHPYVSEFANKVKVATEVTLLVTLVLAVMLKIDLNTERLPCWSDEGDEGFSRAACGESFVGVVMFLTNTVMPAGSLVFGFLTDGLTYDINWDEVKAATAAAKEAAQSVISVEQTNPLSLDDDIEIDPTEVANPAAGLDDT